MTEYDYSPQARQAFQNKLRGVGRWAQQQARYSDAYPNPFVPSAKSDHDGHDADTSKSLRTRGHRDTRHHDEPPFVHPAYPYSHTIYPGEGRPERAPYYRPHDSYSSDTDDSRSRQSGSRSYSSGSNSRSRTSSRSSHSSGYETDGLVRGHSHGSDRYSRSSRDSSSLVSYSSGRPSAPVQYVSQPGRPITFNAAGTQCTILPGSGHRRIEVYSHSPVSAYAPGSSRSRDRKRSEIIVLPASTSGSSYYY